MLLAVAATTALLVVVVAGAALGGGWAMDPAPLPTMTFEAPPPVTAPPEVIAIPNSTTPGTIKQIAGWTVTVIATLIAAYALYRLVRWVHRTILPWLATRFGPPVALPPQPELAALPLPALAAAMVEAEAQLHQGRQPTDAIIAAWLALEDAAVRSGALRAPAQTPTEFTVSVLATTPASPQAVNELLSLYHLARFAHLSMTTTQVAAARAALRQLTDDFRRGARHSATEAPGTTDATATDAGPTVTAETGTGTGTP